MSAWHPRTTALGGGLPNISYIIRKPEPLGTEFKTTACPITGCMLHMGIQRVKEKTKEKQYNREISATAGCIIRILESSHDDGLPHGVKTYAWFGSICATMIVATKDHEGVFQVKQKKACFQRST